MRRNRFEQVDEVQDDAITLELAPEGDAEQARVHVAAMFLAEGQAPTTSDTMPKIEAFSSAVKLANTVKAPIVVIDRDGAWLELWGDLYRPV